MTIDSVKNMKEALCEKLKVSFGSTVEEASDAQMMRASALVPVSYTHLDVYKRQVHVDAARGHIGRNKDRQLAAAEARHDGLALFLRNITVNAVDIESFHHQKRLEPLCHALRVAEGHHENYPIPDDDCENH